MNRMRVLAFAGLATLGLVVTVSAHDGATTERGIAVFADQRCGLCHSIAGNGNKKGPLDDVGARLSAEDIEQWIVAPREMAERTGAGRRPLMKVYPDLSAADLDALVAYMLSLKDGTP